jgi:PAS domain S-box-containing protein
MDNLPGCAWMKDPEGRYVYINRRLENLQPYRDGWRGKTDAQLWPSEMATQYRVNDLKVLASREALQTVEPYLAEGEQRQILVSKFPILDETGAVVLVGGASVEITERLRAEEALRQSEERFRIALKTSPVVVFNHDRDLRYTWVYNPTRGVSAEEILGKTDEELLSSRDAAQLTRIKRHVLECGAGVRTEAELTTGGVRNVYDLNVEPLRDSQGQIIGVTCVALDITDRKRAEEALRATSEQLRALSASLRSAREEEGARIARELHDELGSAMTSLKWDLEDIDKLCSKAGNQTDSSMLREKIAGMMKLIDATINTVRRISWELRPSILDDLGLVAAIEWQAQQFEARTGIVCQFNSFVDNSDLSREQATAIFRTFQEALTNILRHARATRVNIMIEEKEGEFVLEVKDNGRGITDDERTGLRSLGLIGMRERAHLVGGRIEISGVTGQGTVLTLRVPMDSPAAD